MISDKQTGRLLDDGIPNAEKTIFEAGGSISEGVIYFDHPIPSNMEFEVNDAIDFLCAEWDYGNEEE
jgi:hypothetical protein